MGQCGAVGMSIIESLKHQDVGINFDGILPAIIAAGYVTLFIAFGLITTQTK